MTFRFLVPALLLTIASVESFAPLQSMPKRNLRLAASSTSDSSTTSSPVAANASTSSSSSTSVFEVMKSKALTVMNKDTIDQILGNVLSGELGTRGEAFVATQVFLVLCILFGGLPLLGDFLNILCGPVLAVLGVIVCALGIMDMGASLSPWPVPTGDDLVTDGVFSVVRHPIYSGLLAIMAGFSVATGSAARLLLTAALWYALDLKSDYEEEQLLKEHAEYKAYQEAVPGKFVPAEFVAILPWTKNNDDGAFE